MEIPEFCPRRPLFDDKPDGYMESDLDFVMNNFDLAVYLLEQYEQGLLTFKKESVE